MNSYSDSGYQDASSGYHSSQNMGKAELRIQHSFPGAGTSTLGRSARAEGQASAQVLLFLLRKRAMNVFSCTLWICLTHRPAEEP